MSQKLFYSETVDGDKLYSRSIGEHNSVSTGLDNGANNCMAAHFWNCMRHSTTAEMATNFLGRLRTQGGNLNAGGHGDSGLIEYGSGQSGSYNQNTDVYSWNEYIWRPHFESLKDKNFGIYTIYSCHTGADEDGADLLYSLATIMNRPVRARTGFSSCGDGGIGFPDGTWQVAYPGQRPTPIRKARTLMSRTMHPASGMIVIEEAGINVNLQQIDSIDIARADGQLFTTYSGIDAQFIALELFSRPGYDIGGTPLSRVSGKISLFFEHNGIRERSEFEIHNDIAVIVCRSSIIRYIPRSLVRMLTT